MKEQYAEITFRKSTLALIDTINAIITDYVAQGYMLTVRQIYYQLVTRPTDTGSDAKHGPRRPRSQVPGASCYVGLCRDQVCQAQTRRPRL